MSERYIKAHTFIGYEERIVKAISSDPGMKGRKKYDAVVSLSAAVAAIQTAVDSEDIYRTLSESLGACGFHNIVYTLKGETAIPVQASVPLKDFSPHEVGCEAFPDFEKLLKGEPTFQATAQVAAALALPSSLLTVLPPSVVIVPLLWHSIFLFITSESLAEEELPLVSAFTQLFENALSNAMVLKDRGRGQKSAECIIRSVQEGVLMEDHRGIITFVNPSILQMLGYTQEDLIGKPASAIAPLECVPLIEKETQKRPLGIKGQYETSLQCKDGTSLPVIVSATPLFEKKTYIGTLTIFTDISSQKRVEEEIRALRTFSENVIHSMHDALIVEDTRGLITFVNPKAEELLEYKGEEITGHHWQEFTAPEYLQKAAEESARRAHGISGQYESVLLTKCRKRVPVMVGSTPFFANSEFKGVISILMDLTVIKEKEKEINQKNEDLQLVNKINHSLNMGEDLHPILDMAAREILRIFTIDFMAITLLDEERNRLFSENFVFSEALREIFETVTGKKIEKLSFTIEKGTVLEKMVKKKESYFMEENELREVFRENMNREWAKRIQERIRIKSAAAIPLVAAEKTIGAAIIGSRQEVNHSDFYRLRAISKHLALAIHHAQLDETFQKTSEELQARLSEQTLLRKLLEELYQARNEKEVAAAGTEGLKRLGYENAGITLREGKAHTRKGILARAQEQEQTEKALSSIYDLLQKKKAVVSDNIELREKDVSTAPFEVLVCEWIGTLPKKAPELISLMYIPLYVEKEMAGVLGVASEALLAHHDFLMLETIGQIVSQALEKLQYSDALEKKSQDLEFSNKRLKVLQEISNALNSTMDLGEILKILVKGITSVFGYRTPSVYLLSDDRKHLLVKGFDIDSTLLNGITKLVGFTLENYRIPLFEESRLKLVIDGKKPLVTNDITGLLRDYTEDEGLRRLAGALYRLGGVGWVTALPLIAGDEPVGMLVFGSKAQITGEDIDALQGFLDQAALAIAKAKLYEELKEANQMKSEFIDVASHELRTPLTAIKLYLEMMRMSRYGMLTPELEEKIGILQNNAERLQEIIDNTLTSSRILKERLELRKTELNLVELVHDVISQLRPMWELKKQKLEVQTPYVFPLAKADRDGIWKVVNALIDNAVKYSPEGSRITVKLYDLPKEVEAAVIDEGIGIQEKYLQDIFKEFFIISTSDSLSRLDGRMGLGLFIARGIVEAHGGKIWVESVFGLGSSFHFTLPK